MCAYIIEYKYNQYKHTRSSRFSKCPWRGCQPCCLLAQGLFVGGDNTEVLSFVISLSRCCRRDSSSR